MWLSYYLRHILNVSEKACSQTSARGVTSRYRSGVSNGPVAVALPVKQSVVGVGRGFRADTSDSGACVRRGRRGENPPSGGRLLKVKVKVKTWTRELGARGQIPAGTPSEGRQRISPALPALLVGRDCLVGVVPASGPGSWL